MTSIHTRRNAQAELVTLSNQKLEMLERINRQQPRPTNATMGDYRNLEKLASELQHMQQQMLQMQQTIQAQQEASHQAALLAAHQQQKQQEQAAPIGQRNIPYALCHYSSTCLRQDFEIKLDLITLVQRKVFNGLPAEILMEHIESFEEFVALVARMLYH